MTELCTFEFSPIDWPLVQTARGKLGGAGGIASDAGGMSEKARIPSSQLPRPPEQQEQYQEIGRKLIDILANSRPEWKRRRRQKKKHLEVYPELHGILCNMDDQLRSWVMEEVAIRAPQWEDVLSSL